mmetsp:Transcript_27136/g.36258  ORF Transcript_27136/g.36258 Transcript_27136/m.36258 type:complete len:116 (+) Transcript_27136:463-810(+)
MQLADFFAEKQSQIKSALIKARKGSHQVGVGSNGKNTAHKPTRVAQPQAYSALGDIHVPESCNLSKNPSLTDLAIVTNKTTRKKATYQTTPFLKQPNSHQKENKSQQKVAKKSPS